MEVSFLGRLPRLLKHKMLADFKMFKLFMSEILEGESGKFTFEFISMKDGKTYFMADRNSAAYITNLFKN